MNTFSIRKLYVLVLFSMCVAVIKVQAQMDRRIALADKFYANGDFYTAAQLYEQFLNPLDKKKVEGGLPLNSRRTMQGGTGPTISRMDVLYKQAESYRQAFYMLEASARYQECFEKAADRYPAAYYWHAVCQRSLGFYDQAATSLQVFLDKYAASSPFKAAAEQELQTINFSRNQLRRPDTVLFKVRKAATSFGAEKGVFAPAPVSGNSWLVTSTITDSPVKAGVNPYRNRLFTAELSGGALTNVVPLSLDSVRSLLNQGVASVGAGGRFLYLTQWSREKGVTRSGIYVASKTESGWSTPLLLGNVNAEGSNSQQPFVTADGNYLFFSSDRPGGIGGFDLWMAPLQADGSAGAPQHLGATVNTKADDQAPFYDAATKTLVFASKGLPGMGGFDLFTARGWGSEWEAPQNIGYPVNSSRDDVYFYSRSATNLLQEAWISSDRGSNCCLETYTIEKRSKYQRLAGQLLNCNGNLPLAGAAVRLTDDKGNQLQTTTDAAGWYQFNWTTGGKPVQLQFSRDQFKDQQVNVSISATDDSDLLTTVLSQEALCLEPVQIIKPEEVVTVYFDFDKSRLKSRAREQLDSIVAVLVAHPAATIQVSGYTDGLGSEDYNVILGERRAKAVAAYLVKQGIDSSRISFESFGECCPVEMEIINGRDNPDGRSKNRRALINIKKP